MSNPYDKLPAFNAPPDMVIASLRKAIYSRKIEPLVGIPIIPDAAVYDFGRLFDFNTPTAESLTSAETVDMAKTQMATPQRDNHLPYAQCILIGHGVMTGMPDAEHIAVMVATSTVYEHPKLADRKIRTVYTTYQYDPVNKWVAMAVFVWEGEGNQLQAIWQRPVNRLAPEGYDDKIIMGLGATVAAALYLIENPYKGTVTHTQVATSNRPGKDKPHPLQPKSVIYVNINKPKLIKAIEKAKKTHKSPIPHTRQGHWVRYKNKQLLETPYWRKASSINGGVIPTTHVYTNKVRTKQKELVYD